MKEYQEEENGSFSFEGMNIPNDKNNRHRKLMIDELSKGTARVISYVAPIISDKEQIESLRKHYYSYQTPRIDPNFYGLLMAIKSSGTIGTKAKSCLDWLDVLWGNYHTSKELKDYSITDLSSNGDEPSGFSEVRQEAEGVQ